MKTFLTAVLLFTTLLIYAQPQSVVDNKELLTKYLSQTSFDIDTSAQAIVLYEKGTFYYVGNTQTLKIERTIKILGINALNEGNIVIESDDDSYIRKASGTTYNLENGKIVEQSVERRDKLKDELTEDISVLKFNLPNVKIGSIIHYSYTKEMERSLLIPDWYFQEKHPKLCSVFETVLNPRIVFTTVERSSVSLEKVSKRKDLQKCSSCFLQEKTADQNVSIWVRSNIAAFKDEPFMLSSMNYTEMLRTHITAISNDGYNEPIFRDWDQLNNEIYYKNENLGGQVFNNNYFLEAKLNELIANDTTDLAKAKHIFSYVRNNIGYAKQSSRENNNIKSVFKNKKGNVRGINFLLTAMLRKAGLDAEPVLIASRFKECLSPLYTNISSLDYLISKVNIDNKDYFLDGSELYLPFNQLPEYCYNGMARTINKQAKSIFLEPDSLRDRNVTLVNITPMSEAKMQVKLEYILGDVTAYKFRSSCNGDTTTAYSLVDRSILVDMPDFGITKKSVLNIANPDLPLKIIVEGTINFGQSDVTYINPYFNKFFNKNPFETTNRKFPIVMKNRENHTYILSLKLPENYVIDDYPKSSVVKYDGSGAIDFKNTFVYNEPSRVFKVQSQFISNATSFSVEEYSNLREFYDHVIDGLSKKIVIKRLH